MTLGRNEIPRVTRLRGGPPWVGGGAQRALARSLRERALTDKACRSLTRRVTPQMTRRVTQARHVPRRSVAWLQQRARRAAQISPERCLDATAAPQRCALGRRAGAGAGWHASCLF